MTKLIFRHSNKFFFIWKKENNTQEEEMRRTKKTSSIHTYIHTYIYIYIYIFHQNSAQLLYYYMQKALVTYTKDQGFFQFCDIKNLEKNSKKK
jgi:hypothetical protein